jgi:flagellar capping protein FliD
MNIIKNINDAIKREIKRLDKNNRTAFDQIAFLENEIRLMRETMDLMQAETNSLHAQIEKLIAR